MLIASSSKLRYSVKQRQVNFYVLCLIFSHVYQARTASIAGLYLLFTLTGDSASPLEGVLVGFKTSWIPFIIWLYPSSATLHSHCKQCFPLMSQTVCQFVISSKRTKNYVPWPYQVSQTSKFLLLYLPKPHSAWPAGMRQLLPESNKLTKLDRTAPFTTGTQHQVQGLLSWLAPTTLWQQICTTSSTMEVWNMPYLKSMSPISFRMQEKFCQRQEKFCQRQELKIFQTGASLPGGDHSTAHFLSSPKFLRHMITDLIQFGLQTWPSG